MSSNKKISVTMLYMTMMLTIGISNHVLLLPVLLQHAKRDAWVGASAAFAPLIVWICMLYVIIRKTEGRPLMKWLGESYGKTARFLVTAVAVICVFAAATVSLSDTVTWTNVSYLPLTPKFAIVLVLALMCFFAAKAGVRAIAITSGLLLPGVVLLGYFVAVANLQYKNYSLLTPLFTQGYKPALEAMAFTCGSGFELVFILFLQQHVSKAVRMKGLMALGLILVGLTVGPLTGSIVLFGPFEAAEQRYPAFEQWRMVTMGKFISHLDFLSIYQWISGAFVRVSLMLFLIPDLMGVKNAKRRLYVLVASSVILIGFVLLPISDLKLLDAIAKWYYPGITAVNGLLVPVLLVLVLLSRKKEGGRT